MLWNAITLAQREIRANLLRSILTALGIIIGVASVITMVTLGTGVSQQIQSEVTSLGRSSIFLAPFFRAGGGPGQPAPPFKEQDVIAIERSIPGVDHVAAIVRKPAVLVYGTENYPIVMQGVSGQYFDIREWPLIEGRLFTDAEQLAGRAVCILGETPRQKLFGAQSPIGYRIRVGQVPCEVVGVLEPRGRDTFGNDQDEIALMPVRAVQLRLAGNRNIDRIWVTAVDEAESDRVTADLEALMTERRRIPRGQDPDFLIQQAKEVAALAATITGIMTLFLSAVAAVSLVVGGIGIMNVMLVSVTERTREIGIRLAIGALERDVLTQFLVEAVMLSAIGGVIGIGLGLGLSALAAVLLNLPFIVSPGLIALAFLFSAAVGVAFGFFPARRAARLNPIDALRYE